MLSRFKGTVCRALTVLFLTIVLVNAQNAVTVHASEGKVLDAISEDGDYTIRKQRYQFVKALNKLRQMGLSPVDMIDRLLGGEVSIPDTSELSEKTGEIAESIQEKIPGFDKIPGISEETADAISDAADKVSETGSELAQAAKDAAELMQEKAEKESEEIVEGTKKGIREKLMEIIDGILDKF